MNKKVDHIIKDIEHSFGFLYEKGFKIRSAESSPQFNGNWVVELESLYCLIYITSDRNYIMLEFSSVNNLDIKKRITIEKLIYLLSNGQNIIGAFKGNLAWSKKKQFDRLSDLLKEYIDQITFYYREANKN